MGSMGSAYPPPMLSSDFLLGGDGDDRVVGSVGWEGGVEGSGEGAGKGLGWGTGVVAIPRSGGR